MPQSKEEEMGSKGHYILQKYDYVPNMDEDGYRRHFASGDYKFVWFGYLPESVEWKFCQARNNGSQMYKFKIEVCSGNATYYVPKSIPSQLAKPSEPIDFWELFERFAAAGFRPL